MPRMRTIARAVLLVAAGSMMLPAGAAGGQAAMAPATLIPDGLCFSDAADDTVYYEISQDSSTTPFAAADILRSCVALGAETLTVTADLAGPTDPLTDPDWQPKPSSETPVSNTGPLWHIAADGDLERGYRIYLGLDEGEIVVLVFPFGSEEDIDDGQVLCRGSGRFEGGSYVAEVSTACLANPTVVQTNMDFLYNVEDPGILWSYYEDLSPEGGVRNFHPPVTRADPQVPQTARLAGATRIETAVLISRARFPEGAATVYLARADSYADALAGAGAADGPVLLVPPTCGAVPTAVTGEIGRLQPSLVVALGGEQAVCQATLDAAAGR